MQAEEQLMLLFLFQNESGPRVSEFLICKHKSYLMLYTIYALTTAEWKLRSECCKILIP